MKGAPPSSPPIELPARLETVINLKIAQLLGVDIPQLLLLRADEVIQ
jgi:putative tryptophan/tyrosine transport system substrate-binding protein